MELKAKSFLLIGGPFDGQRTTPDPQKVLWGETLCLPVPAKLSIDDFKTVEDLPPQAAMPEVAYYQPERLRGEKIEVIFYRYRETSLDEALLRLFERYQGDAIEESALTRVVVYGKAGRPKNAEKKGAKRK